MKKRTVVKSLSPEELGKDDLRYMHFAITVDGRFRCGGGEDKYGNDCDFKTFKKLSYLAKHFERHHI